MGDSLSWARDREREEEARQEQEQADAIREKIVTEWGDWSLEKMKMVEIIAKLERSDVERMLKLMREFDNLKLYFQMQRKMAEGKLW